MVKPHQRPRHVPREVGEVAGIWPTAHRGEKRFRGRSVNRHRGSVKVTEPVRVHLPRTQLAMTSDVDTDSRRISISREGSHLGPLWSKELRRRAREGTCQSRPTPPDLFTFA